MIKAVVNDPPHLKPGAAIPLKVFSIVRYRFFLYAGLLPYLLGAAWAYGIEETFRPGVFWTGFMGIFLSVVGVEAFNEYFDSRMGTDRVFNPDDEDPIPDWVLTLGIGAFAAAASVGLYLAVAGGWPIVLYTLLGGLAAVFYVGPPIRWVYRGLGETMIALSYGPWMTLGSLHLQTGHFSWGALLASCVPGFLIMALAVVNAIPDFHQDRLVGKRNIVVRVGRLNGVRVYLGLAALGLLTPVAGVAAGLFPTGALAALLAAPLLVLSGREAFKTYDTPREFIPAVRYIVVCYIAGTTLFTAALFLHRWI
ncbi:MAG: prenyltransferase [Elusimicrobia bacterium]|nr:prenyltransferase [Elusimicrobiota bacterium]